MLKISGIYKISSPSGNFYIGSSANIHNRWIAHKGYLRNNKHTNPKLQAAWLKYGESGLVLTVLEACKTTELLAREQFYLDTLQPVYNIAKDAVSPMRGLKHTEEAKRKMSQPGSLNPFYGRTLSSEHRAVLDRTGTRHKPETLEKYKKRKGENNAFYGKHHTETTREKLRSAAVGRKHSEETKAKISKASSGENNGNYGNVGVYTHTEETKAKMREAAKGKVRKPLTAEHRANIAAAAKGRVLKPLTTEQKAKLSALAKTRWAVKKAQANGHIHT